MEMRIVTARTWLCLSHVLAIGGSKMGMQFLLQFETSNHTLSHIDCPACDLIRNRALMYICGEQRFEEAARLFYELKSLDPFPERRAVFVEKNTLKGYKRFTASLSLFFAGMLLKDISWVNMRAYQDVRTAGAAPFVRYRRPQDAKPKKLKGGFVMPAKGPTPCKAKAAQVNQELGFLKRLKRMAGCWTAEDERYYQDLKEEESEVQRALSIEEQGRWLEVAQSRPRWELIFLYSMVAFDTCCSTNELRALRLGDIRLNYHLISIPWPGSKNKYRHRDIALESANTEWALLKLMERAKCLGAGEPHLNPTAYLFPLRDRQTREYDPSRPMTESGLKRMWEEVRKESGLTWFRPYDTRHTACTRLAERGVPIDIIMARAGHVGEKTRQRYTHIMVAAQRQWLRPGENGVYKLDSTPQFGSSYAQRSRYFA